MINRDKIYIDGAWVASSGKGTIDVVNATTEEVMGTMISVDVREAASSWVLASRVPAIAR